MHYLLKSKVIYLIYCRFRDSYDELSKCLKHYSDDEEINESFSDGLKNFTNAVTILADYMDLNVHRMEMKVIYFENLL